MTVPFILKGEPTLDLGHIYTQDDVLKLQGVEIIAQKPLVKMEVDKMSYSVADDIDSKSNTVLDMLRKVPMVTVDGNDNITVNGSSSFKVYLDGKPNVMMSNNPSEVFKNMPASGIKNIEVITNPGARYDAEGVGGVLNLTTEKTQATNNRMIGYDANLRSMASSNGWGCGFYFNTQQGKLSLSINGNLMQRKMKDMEAQTERTQIGISDNMLMNYEQIGNTDINMKMGNVNLGYEIDSLRLVTVSFGLMGFGSGNNFQSETSMKGGVYGSGLNYHGHNNSDNDRTSINGSIDYQRSFAGNKDRVLTLSYLISTSPNNTDSYNLFDTDDENSFLNLANRYTDAYRNTVENTFQADYSTPIGKGQTIDLGAKYILRNNVSDSKYYTSKDGSYEYDAQSSLNYKHSNDILAGYMEYSLKKKQWNTKAGLRYEHTWQDVVYKSRPETDFKLNYNNLVPSASISYTIDQKQNIGLAYNMRISRPGIGLLNPYVDNSDPTAISYGNSNLKPEKAHNISLVYNRFTHKWMMNLTLRQSFCNNAIEGYSFYQDDILNSTYGNIVKNSQSGLNAYINWNAGPKTRFTINGSGSYTNIKSTQLGLENSGWQGNIMLGYQQTLPWNIRLSMNLMTSTKTYNLQGWSTGFNALMGSISRTFFKERVSVSISGCNSLSGDGLKFKSYSKGNDFINRTVTAIPISNIGLNVSYTFGKKLTIKQPKRSIKNTDVKENQSQSESIGNMLVNDKIQK
ncbi:TonB-dependent receptor domain-containing protein [Bacteroides graminisolvens]|uniref:TonB-dependent receptor domain-containing protein n=1 Tax=Bacteroides graminisolvens TaxID=477666 RepID=UPI00240A14A3|nr:TonB-dependent receptor [Bacteroides graminisolvens]